MKGFHPAGLSESCIAIKAVLAEPAVFKIFLLFTSSVDNALLHDFYASFVFLLKIGQF